MALRNVSRNVWLLGVVSLLTDTASEMCLPLFALLMASLGGGAQLLGLMEGAADAVSALIKGWSGARSDRTARKPWTVVGYTVAALARPLMAWVGTPLQMVGVRSMDRVGKGLRSAPRDALLADSTAPEHRAEAFGFHRAMDHAGAMLGPLVAAGVLYRGASPQQVRMVFVASVVPGLLAAAILVAFVREPTLAPSLGDTPAPPPSSGPHAPGRRLLLTVTGFFSLIRFQEILFLAVLARMGAPAYWLPLFWSAMHVVKSATGTPLGRFADRFGRERALALGYAVYAATVALLAVATTPARVLGAMLCFALHTGLTEGVEKALVASRWPKEARGRGFGLYHALTALVALPSGYAQGLLLERGGGGALGLTLMAAGGVATAGALMFAHVSTRPVSG